MVHFWLVRAIQETEPKTEAHQDDVVDEVLLVDWAKTRSQIQATHFSSPASSGGSPVGAGAPQNIVADG